MADEPPKIEWTAREKRAWGEALVKTGTEHLDLAMVRQGKQTLKEAEAMPDKPEA
jgi:hypothetical protein